MKIKLISAVSLDGAIGKNNGLLWHLKEDLQHFKKETLNKLLLVGVNTFNSLPAAAKKGRHFLIVNSNCEPVISMNEHDTGYFTVTGFQTPEDAIAAANELLKAQELIIIGGAMIYNTTIKYADECIITHINNMYSDADAVFPVDKLNNMFTIINDSKWTKSESGLLYKMTTYKRNI